MAIGSQPPLLIGARVVVKPESENNYVEFILIQLLYS